MEIRFPTYPLILLEKNRGILAGKYHPSLIGAFGLKPTAFRKNLKSRAAGLLLLGSLCNYFFDRTLQVDNPFDDIDLALYIGYNPAYFDHLNRFDYGLNGTAGIEGKSTTFSINYGLGLATVKDKNMGEEKHSVLSFTVGLKL